MTPFMQFLIDKSLPGFALLKNAKTKLVPGLGYQVQDFDEIQWNSKIEPLLDLLPKPELLSGKEARELATWRFSEVEISNKEFIFNTLPSALLNEAGDREIFGCAYTLFWVAEPDTQWLVNAVISYFPSDSTEKISAELLKTVWGNTMDRLFFRQSGQEGMELHMLADEMIDAVIAAINALPNAPESDAWDALNEEPDWGDDF